MVTIYIHLGIVRICCNLYCKVPSIVCIGKTHVYRKYFKLVQYQ